MTQPCIVQFGTSRFLQAHVDLLAQEARDAGQDVAPVVIVQMTDDPARASRLQGFRDPKGFPVQVRGLGADGAVVERDEVVRVVANALSAARDWPGLAAIFEARARFVVSNSGDTGYEVDPRDRSPAILQGHVAPRSFPAMLTALLYARWRARGEGLVILPCELVRRNGEVLKGVVRELTQETDAPAPFLTWLDSACVWANTLVDRIVSEPIEPVGAVAEPYALWAVERQPGLELPFTHPSLVLTDDLEVYERLKLHILNLGHTWLAEEWLLMGAPRGMNVREILADARVGARFDALYETEVLPGFNACGLGALAPEYLARTMERFKNPFLDHKLADIFQSHRQKVAKRIEGFVDWVDASGERLELPVLRAFAGRYAEAA